MEAKYELVKILNNELTSNIPVALLGNKIDKFGALSEQEIRDIFNVPNSFSADVSYWLFIERFSI